MSLGTIGACQKKMSDGDWPCPNPGYVLCCSLRGVYPRAGTHAARPTAARTLTLHGAARAIGARRLDWRALAAATSPKPKAGRTFGVRLASFKLETGPAIRTMCWLQLFVWCVCVCVCVSVLTACVCLFFSSCGRCGNVNWERRSECNMCKSSKPGMPGLVRGQVSALEW